MEPHTPRLKWVVSIATIFVTVLTIIFGNISTVSAASLPGPLPGSTFEGGDGNLTVDTTGNTDWSNVQGVNIGIDLPSGTTDNSFGQGAKEDLPNPTIVFGSIPPNKNDLTRFYEASEFTNNSNFLYLAWERAVNIGSADIDFEINHLQCGPSTPQNCTGNGVTTVRTAGDLLVLFEFSGSGTPTIQISKWVVSGTNAKADCEAGGPYPCWGAVQTLNNTDSEAAVNAATVPDPLNNNAPLTTGLFGETAINLTLAGVFPSGTCSHFGSAYTKARTSGSSFDSELKDFIAPIPVNISNCGEIKIHKVTQPTGGTGFGFTTTGAAPVQAFSLNDGGTQDFTNVAPGNYSVTESAKTGWDFVSLACSATGSGTTATPASSTTNKTASITVSPGGVADCTYTNHVHASPTIATSLSSSTINVAGSANDTATLTGATFDAGGSVAYSVYSSLANCTAGTNGTSAGTKTVTNGIVPASDPVTFNTAGTYYWQAVYSGDAHNDTASSACTSEVMIVKTNPTITTTLVPASPVSIGTAVHDTSSLGGATSDASGTVTYTVYSSQADCLAGKNGTSAGTKAVTNGAVTDSDPITFSNATTYYWQAVYSGDSKNNAASSDCASEPLVVNPNTTSMVTAQNLIPNDSATLSGATASATGTITFKLYSPSDAGCSGTPAYTQTDTVGGGVTTYSTSNSTFITSAVGTWRWQVTYSGDTNNVGSTSACGVEQFSLTNG